MDESAAASLALGAAQTLEGIGQDVAQIKGQNSDVLAAIENLRVSNVECFRDLIARDSSQPLALDDSDPAQWQTVVSSNTEVPESFFTHLMGFQYMHTVLFVFMLLALLLNLGATLWLAFSDKWRS